MSADACLTTDLNEIFKDGRSRNADLGDDDATSAKDDVVPDLHQIIETRTGTDHRVSPRSSINGRIGADFDIVLENRAPELRHRQKSSFDEGESKSFLSDPRAGIDVDARSQQRMAQTDMCANPAIPADNHAASDNRTGSEPAAWTDRCAGFDNAQRSDFRGRIDERVLRDHCRGMDTG